MHVSECIMHGGGLKARSVRRGGHSYADMSVDIAPGKFVEDGVDG